ncbi:dynactin subunit 3-like [Dysidea avara]|uniref:dynactin subunit 3-like n=1 Tax=Dysidea avara TaxID=196820 RepID=UPI00332A3309
MDARKVVDQGYLDSLGDRIERMRVKLLDNYEFGKDRKPILKELRDLERRVTELGSRENIKNTWAEIKELDTLLSPEYVQKLGTSDEVKTEVVLHRADEIEQVSSQLAEVNELKDYINLKNVQDIETLEKKVITQSQLHIFQQSSVAELSKEVTDMVANYNTIVEGLSQKFLEMDKLLTKLEADK